DDRADQIEAVARGVMPESGGRRRIERAQIHGSCPAGRWRTIPAPRYAKSVAISWRKSGVPTVAAPAPEGKRLSCQGLREFFVPAAACGRACRLDARPCAKVRARRSLARYSPN